MAIFPVSGELAIFPVSTRLDSESEKPHSVPQKVPTMRDDCEAQKPAARCASYLLARQENSAKTANQLTVEAEHPGSLNMQNAPPDPSTGSWR